MDGYEPVTTFDESNAAVYDSLAVRGDEEVAVAFHARYGGWQHEPFTKQSELHVSVWGR
jgi:hypothetical protein